MAASRKSIPVHRLRETTEDGFQMEWVYSDSDAMREGILLDVHRDDHYIFFFQETGRSEGMVDFRTFILEGRTLFFILPGQVHKYMYSTETMTGWFVALDEGLIPGMFRAILEDPSLVKRPLVPDAADADAISQCLQLIQSVNSRQPLTGQSKQVIYALLTSFIAMAAAVYAGRDEALPEQASRPALIAQRFRKLVAREYKSNKSPAAYAAALNLSLSYLNEVVKAETGFTVSHWIQQEIVLEAKRLLYHSDCSVKEVAHELGYEDHTYFSRFFKKATLQTPGEFRQNYRE